MNFIKFVIENSISIVQNTDYPKRRSFELQLSEYSLIIMHVRI